MLGPFSFASSDSNPQPPSPPFDRPLPPFTADQPPTVTLCPDPPSPLHSFSFHYHHPSPSPSSLSQSTHTYSKFLDPHRPSSCLISTITVGLPLQFLCLPSSRPPIPFPCSPISNPRLIRSLPNLSTHPSRSQPDALPSSHFPIRTRHASSSAAGFPLFTADGRTSSPSPSVFHAFVALVFFFFFFLRRSLPFSFLPHRRRFLSPLCFSYQVRGVL